MIMSQYIVANNKPGVRPQHHAFDRNLLGHSLMRTNRDALF